MDDFLKKQGFSVIDADCCIYSKNVKGETIMLTLYVDDLMIASNSELLCSILRENLNKRFEMKDFGKVRRCLGLEFN